MDQQPWGDALKGAFKLVFLLGVLTGMMLGASIALLAMR